MATDESQQGSLEGYGVAPVDACRNYEVCASRTPGGEEANNSLCSDCLDAARYRDSPLPDPRDE